MRTTDEFVFFYGGFMSQWYRSKFTVDGVTYCTAEQYMMAMKAEYFGDTDIQKKIMATTDPSEQKALGRQVSNFNAEAWNAVSRGYVYKANMAKFTQDNTLKEYLLETGDRELVEASPYDKIWGIGMNENQPGVTSKCNWKGTNWLGETLTKVRNDIRKSAESKQ
jgi:ribA/ribD-fused uncharacterized protein